MFRCRERRSSFAHLRHYTATVREWGEGPPLVLVPGLAGGTELMEPLARCLARDFHVISYELRGEEDCFALRRRFGMPDLVNDLAEFLDERRLEQPAVFGVTFGGVLALEFAAKFPTRIRALAVQGVGVKFEPGLVRQVAGTVLKRYPLPTDCPFINQFFNLLFGCRPEPGPLPAFVVRQCWKTDQAVMAHRFRLIERRDLSGKLDRVQVPTLVMTGKRDVFVSEANVAALCQGLPRCQRVDLPIGGHLTAVLQPEAASEQVCRFLDEVGYRTADE